VLPEETGGDALGKRVERFALRGFPGSEKHATNLPEAIADGLPVLVSLAIVD
jgi:hypothetical protein